VKVKCNANVGDHKVDGEEASMKNFPSKLTGNLENVFKSRLQPPFSSVPVVKGCFVLFTVEWRLVGSK
jgi:hypothetical protein